MQAQYLEEILAKIENRIKELDVSIGEGVKDIEEMHEYYWSNYTEMDEYGYENFDNRQALLTQMNANSQQMDLKRRFLRMLDSPYFARIDFLYDGEEEAEQYYIGIGNFSEGAGHTPLIVDWRAPVASLFYDFDKGRASFETPQGVSTGEISAKWQYKIKHGKLIYAFESDVKIDDEILKNELGNNGDVKLKNIVSTIQREQNAIIRNVQDKILVVQGAAGSGKTSIALHRIAYLLYHDRKNLSASNVLILSPNGVFSDYISHILPELGEENIREMSFDIFAYRELKGIVSDCEERYDQIERMMAAEREHAGTEGEESSQYRYKQSKEFVNELNGFILELESDLVDFRTIHFKFVNKKADELMELFYYKFPDIPLLSRMEAVAEYVVDEAETLNGRNLDELEMAVIMETFHRMYRTKDIYKLYNEFLSRMNMAALPDCPPQERKLRYEDVYPVLYLKYRLTANVRRREIKHLLIDEMQDYSYIQYLIIHELFDCKMTILGDYSQTMEDEKSDVTRFLPKIFGKDIRMLTINKSYRQTVEIARYAGGLIEETGVELFERHGKEPYICGHISYDKTIEELTEQLTKESGRFETSAVLAMTEREAKRLYERLKERVEGHSVLYIDRDSKEFQKGIVVTTFYLAKGLEFDRVFCVYGEKCTSPLCVQAKYIMATRALHELYVYEHEEEI